MAKPFADVSTNFRFTSGGCQARRSFVLWGRIKSVGPQWNLEGHETFLDSRYQGHKTSITGRFDCSRQQRSGSSSDLHASVNVPQPKQRDPQDRLSRGNSKSSSYTCAVVFVCHVTERAASSPPAALTPSVTSTNTSRLDASSDA